MLFRPRPARNDCVRAATCNEDPIMLSLLLTAAAFAPQGPGPSLAPVVINEFAYDDAGTDDKEFIELYNRTNASIDLGGWIVRCVEGSTPGGTNTFFTIPAGTMIAAGGYVVVGTATVPNLTPGCTVAVNFLENTTLADGITLEDTTTAVVDSVLWGYAGWTAPIPTYVEGTGLWGRVFLQDTVANTVFTSAQRRVDGWDSNDNGADFVYMMWTPGAANGSANTLALNVVEKCDGAPATALSNDFASSFAPAVLADPANITRAIVTSVPYSLTIPASPQGGNVAVLHDPTGGGNSQYLRVPVGEDFLVECYVYVNGGNAAIGATEGEAFAMGVGTTDSYASPADVPGTYYAATSACTGVGNREPGSTGIAWMAYQTTNQTDFYLVNRNAGGPGGTILGGPITATVGTNDGWQRLRLRVSGTSVVGNFGGTFGADDGQRFTATVPNRIAGQVYFQYRECVLANQNLLPLIIDNLQVFGIVPFGVNTAGAASPTTQGTPNLTTSGGDPVLGNLGFGYAISGHVPNGVGALLIGIGGFTAPTPVPGAPATVNTYVAPVSTVLLFSDGLGAASFGLGLPASNALAGLPLTTQSVDFDTALPYATPIGCSQAVQIVVGN